MLSITIAWGKEITKGRNPSKLLPHTSKVCLFFFFLVRATVKQSPPSSDLLEGLLQKPAFNAARRALDLPTSDSTINWGRTQCQGSLSLSLSTQREKERFDVYLSAQTWSFSSGSKLWLSAAESDRHVSANLWTTTFSNIHQPERTHTTINQKQVLKHRKQCTNFASHVKRFIGLNTVLQHFCQSSTQFTW